MVLGRFLQEELLQFLELFGVLRGQIVRRTEVLFDVVQFPFVFQQGMPRLALPGGAVNGMGQPAVVVDAAVAEDLEVLRLVPVFRFGVVKRVDHAHAFDGRLRRAVDGLGLGQAGRFEDGRRDVDDVVPLRPHLTLGLDSLGPVDDQRIAAAAVGAGDLLRPGEGRVAGHGPAGRVVRVGVRAAQIVVVLEDFRDGFVHAIEIGHLVEQAVHRAFGARAIVPDLVEDQRVVELAEVFDCLDEPADFVVGVFAEAGEDFHLAGEELLLIVGELVPVLDGFRLGGEFGALGNDAQRDLAGQRFLAELVPALIEFALVLRDPLFRGVVRGVRCARREVDEKRLIGSQCFLALDHLIAWLVMSFMKW